ncbi:MAG: DNA integrity scanning protein DisA nucleotide-binding domain protein [Deltaproteobacteria bacterium]|nr:DNA integrity scanning protein DisA nucleotide-binding domain protein [Deltaproteobacteria bacterium]
MIGKVVASIYRAALDVSFKRTGALFVVLRNRKSLRSVVRTGDAIGDDERARHDREFDRSLSQRKFHVLPRCVAAEISGLDGAVVLANSGELLAYGAVLDPRKAGRLRGTEGSRTKAAIGASNYGLAVKVSSDGDITVFAQGKRFLKV